MSKVNRFGFKLGDRFEVVGCRKHETTKYSIGSVIELARDDKTNCPEFRLISGDRINGFEHPDWLNFEYYDNLKKIE